jgi:hypothetical protein
MRGEEGYRLQGWSPRRAAADTPAEARGTTAGCCGRGKTDRLSVARAIVLAGQDVGGLGSMVGRRGVGHSRGQAAQEQTRQAQGEEPASWVKGSVYHHWAGLTLLGTRKPVLIVTVVAGFTSCSPQSG